MAQLSNTTNWLKDKIILHSESLHLRIFGHEMSPMMRDFLKHLSWSFLGGGIASAVMMIINIGAGRLMGPAGYGNYGLVLAISQVFMIPIILGLDVSSVRSISTAQNNREKEKNISSPFYFILFSSLVFILVFLAFHNFISKKFNINSTILLIAALYAVIVSLKSISDSFARALFLFKEQFFARILEVATIVVLFSLFFFFCDKQNYIFYIFALLSGSLMFSLFLFRKYLKYLTHFDLQSLKIQLSYSSILLVGATFNAVYNILEKMIIAKYLSIYDLGIYMAYYTASFNMTAQITQMFLNVFFPSIAKMPARTIITKLEKLIRILFFPIFFIILSIIFIIIKLFGKDYGINITYLFGFSLLATLQIILSINYYIFASSTKKMYRKYVFCVSIINFSQMLAYGILIYFRVVSIDLVIILSIINSVTNIILQKRLLINNKNKNESSML
jgi:O-antigen/teichoic acid export membrane protein